MLFVRIWMRFMKLKNIYCIHNIHIFMPPTSKKLRGHIGLGPSVSPSVRPSVCPYYFGSWKTQESLMLESWNYIYGMYMKNKRTRFFFSSTSPVILELCPFFNYVWKTLWTEYLENCYSLNPDIWHIVTDQDVDELINFWTKSVNFRWSYSPFSDIGILYRNNLVNKIS